MKKLIFLLPLIFLSCAKKDIVSITIQHNMSSEIDLFKGKYIVHFMDKDDFHYDFPISKDEILEVKRTYDNQNITNLERELLIVDDKPLIMPSSDIKYIINFSNGSRQIFIVRTDFRKNPLDIEKYQNLKIFIETIDNIIESKKEIKNAKKSNALYF